MLIVFIILVNYQVIHILFMIIEIYTFIIDTNFIS